MRAELRTIQLDTWRPSGDLVVLCADASPTRGLRDLVGSANAPAAEPPPPIARASLIVSGPTFGRQGAGVAEAAHYVQLLDADFQPLALSVDDELVASLGRLATSLAEHRSIVAEAVHAAGGGAGPFGAADAPRVCAPARLLFVERLRVSPIHVTPVSYTHLTLPTILLV